MWGKNYLFFSLIEVEGNRNIVRTMIPQHCKNDSSGRAKSDGIRPFHSSITGNARTALMPRAKSIPRIQVKKKPSIFIMQTLMSKKRTE